MVDSLKKSPTKHKQNFRGVYKLLFFLAWFLSIKLGSIAWSPIFIPIQPFPGDSLSRRLSITGLGAPFPLPPWKGPKLFSARPHFGREKKNVESDHSKPAFAGGGIGGNLAGTVVALATIGNSGHLVRCFSTIPGGDCRISGCHWFHWSQKKIWGPLGDPPPLKYPQNN